MNDKAEKRNKTVVTVISRISEKPIGKEACLVVIYGLDLGKKFNLEAPAIIIGRSSKSDIQVDQESVSRNHAKIINTGKTIILRDLGSTNGTYVNDELIDEYVLRDGDFIKIGRTIFKFLSGNNIENAYHEEIYRLTTIDGLTQIYNKRYFLETLKREISRAHRYRRELSLIMFDIDHFKKVNDTYGHLAGDYVLKQLASVIKARIRREDIMARYGGEEFAIILPEIDSFNSVQFADKIRKLIEKTTFKFEETKIPVTISVGVSSVGPGSNADLHNPVEFIKTADDKLYQAKSQGRNQVVGKGGERERSKVDMRVLVIDDDDDILQLTRQALSAGGHDVTTAKNGEEGLALAEKASPDLAIVDLSMPGIDGWEVIRRLKASTKNGPFFPVILFTAMDDVSNRVRGFQAGCDDFLGKPVDLHELKVRVHSLLMRRSQDMELRKMNERLVEAHKLKGDLASLVVHDLRNPLSALAGNVEILEDELATASPTVRDSLGDCKVLVARALSLLAGLLDVAQLEEGILRVHYAEVPVAQVLAAGARTSTAYVKSRNLKVIIDVTPDDLRGTFDADLVGRILENLIANAVRYATNGGKLRLAATREGTDLVFTVGNDGPPIPLDERPRIFEKFYRIDERRAGARANRGLGLYFCRLAAEAHDGSIKVEETPEYPTTFVIRIPQR